MADIVTTQVLQNSEMEYVVHLTCLSDSTGETTVTKIDRSALTNTNGVAPMSIDILSVRWNIQGFTYVKLSWDHSTDDTAMFLSGNGYENFEAYGGLRDPRTSAITGASGDILLSSVGGVATGTYDITIVCRLQ